MSAKHWFGLIIFMVLIASLFGKKSSSTGSGISIDRSSPEYRYAEERVRSEGYSRDDSRRAADAIMKFEKVQQYRRDGIIK